MAQGLIELQLLVTGKPRTDKPIVTSNGNKKVGVKRALVFYGGKPPRGIKTNWIMHEYRLVDNNSTSRPQIADVPNWKTSLRVRS